MNSSKIKTSIAQALRRLAHRLSPEDYVYDSFEWTLSRNKAPHVDIRLRHGERIKGYVVDDANELGLNKGLPGVADRLKAGIAGAWPVLPNHP